MSLSAKLIQQIRAAAREAENFLLYEVGGRSSARAPVSALARLLELLRRLEQLGDDVGYEAQQGKTYAEQLQRELDQERARTRDV